MGILNLRRSGKFTKHEVKTGKDCSQGNLLEIVHDEAVVGRINESGQFWAEERDKVIEVLKDS